MKKISKILLLTLGIFALSFNSANAEEIIYHYGDGTSGTTPPTPAQAAIGGFAVVNPETGVVHGIITGSIEYFGNNDKTMGNEYMGCAAGCKIIMQSTADKNGNVAGIHGPNVTYNNNRNIYQIIENNVNQSEIITEFSSNTSTVETVINVNRSQKVYEFGVQDFTNSDGNFQFVEVSPNQNTSAQISATTTNFVCEESSIICSRQNSNSSNTLNQEITNFDERKTSEQIQTQIIAEAKAKIREQISLILTMLERWIID